tara:strand:+ start:44 stop:280 length:237 start_codon:yes stop_codon:yes gene_type:complete
MCLDIFKNFYDIFIQKITKSTQTYEQLDNTILSELDHSNLIDGDYETDSNSNTNSNPNSEEWKQYVWTNNDLSTMDVI